ncbi:hypothetical protein EHS25_001399 [Saitozyma podzolica]|uniref:Sugar phosphate phosphatase n=1 Tax=Saitozyma podzolica TaxID=1890683 RepID=A0A427YG33_9TREE|nr:hypothetical protein EHS25_001399 [Saitozyma podzolica]
MEQVYQLPFDRYSPRDKQSFAYTTVIKRWPVILTNIVSSISNDLHELHSSTEPSAKDKIAEGKEIVSKISALKHEMGRNGSLTPIDDDGEANVGCYNEELQAHPEEDRHWFTMNWLFAECYLYRRLRNLFSATQHWKQYDPFFASKAETYKSSSGAIIREPRLARHG